MATQVLQDLGYAIVPAADGPSALDLLRNLPAIDLLITGTAPAGGLSGRQIAERARAIRPDIALLLIGGDQYDLPHPLHGVSILSNPCTGLDLAKAVRAALGRVTEADA